MAFLNQVLKPFTAAPAFRGGAEAVTLTDDVTMTRRTATLSAVDPGGASRTSTLPEEGGNDGLWFIHSNAGSAGEVLTYEDDGGATILTLSAAEVGLFICDGTDWTGILISQSMSLPAASDVTIVAGVATLTDPVHTVRGAGAAADDCDTISGMTDAGWSILMTGAEAITYRDASVGAGNLATNGDTSIVTATGDMVMAVRSGAVVSVTPISLAAGTPPGDIALARGSMLAGNAAAQAAAVDVSAADAVAIGDGTDVVAMALPTTGMVAKTALNTAAGRTLANGTNGGLAVTNGDGVAGAPTFAVDLNDLAAAVLDPTADSFAFLDATDASTKIELIDDLVTLLLGNGLVNTATQFVVSPDVTTGGTTIPVDVAANGVGVDVADIAPALVAAAIDVANDGIVIADATDTFTKVEAWADIATAMAGGGLAATAGVLATDNAYDAGTVATWRMDFVNTPVTGDTATIGADVYEFRAAAEQISNDTYVGVFLGVSAAACLTNWVAAINGAGTGIADGILAVGGGGPLLVENGTETVFADEIATDLRCRYADAVGGTPAAGDPSIVLAENITNAANIWDCGDVNTNTLAGAIAGHRPHAVTQVTVTTAMITNGLMINFPFVVTHFRVYPSVAGVPRWQDTAVTDAFALTSEGIGCAFGGGAAPNIQNGDTLDIEAWGATT